MRASRFCRRSGSRGRNAPDVNIEGSPATKGRANPNPAGWGFVWGRTE
jgi:hypothetical protein